MSVTTLNPGEKWTAARANTKLEAPILLAELAAAVTAAWEDTLGNPGTSGHILASTTAGVRSWVDPATLGSHPMTELGDTVYGGASGVMTRLAGNITATKQFLTQTGDGAASAAPAWGALASGDVTAALGFTPSANPMTTAGDIIYGGAAGVATRLAGAVGVLTNDGAGGLTWGAAAGHNHDATYVNVAGDTMTGALAISSGGIAVTGDSTITGVLSGITSLIGNHGAVNATPRGYWLNLSGGTAAPALRMGTSEVLHIGGGDSPNYNVQVDIWAAGATIMQINGSGAELTLGRMRAPVILGYDSAATDVTTIKAEHAGGFTATDMENRFDFVQGATVLGRLASYYAGSTTWGLRFYGYTAGATTLFGTWDPSGRLSVGTGFTAASLLHVRKDNTSSTSITVQNGTAGSNAQVNVNMVSDSISLSFGATSSSTAFGGLFAASQGYMQADGAGGLLLGVNHATGPIVFFSGGSAATAANEKMRLTSAGLLGINAATNTKMTQGVTISQAGNDDEILAFKSSDVAHGMTVLAESNTWFNARKYHATDGGAWVQGLGGASAVTGFAVTGIAGTADSTRATTSSAPIILDAALKSTTSKATMGADKNLLCISDNFTTRFVFDSDGDFFADVSSGTFDAYDDVALIRTLEVERSPNSVIRSEFDQYLRYNRKALVDAKIATFNDGLSGDGSIFVNYTGLTRLHSGAIWQLHQRLSTLEQGDTELDRVQRRVFELEKEVSWLRHALERGVN